MGITSQAPTQPADQFVQNIADLQRRIADLERAASRAGAGRRNLLDNGAMNVCQRATSLAGINSVNGVRVSDRWWMILSGGPAWTVSNVAEAPAGTGLTRSQKWLCTTASASPAAGEYTEQSQGIEGRFLQHLLWGTANAKPLTRSFWVRSNKTGTYVAELFHVAAGTFYGLAYTIDVADTWEYKTLTYPGNTATTIPDDSTGGLYLNFWLNVGSTYGGGASLNTWTATNNKRAVGQTNLAGAVNNYWQFTGAQLEIGTAATLFDIRSYDIELRKSQRYLDASPLGGLYPILGFGTLETSTTSVILVIHKVTMRAPPAVSYVGALRTVSHWDGAGYAVSAIADPGSGQITVDQSLLHVTHAAAVAAVRPMQLSGNNDATAQLRLSAEI